MRFMEAYKHLDNLLKTFEDYPKGVSSYIEKMEMCYDSRYQCGSWKTDYDNLKRYRYIRNQISHDNYASEENMCVSADELWIRDFHSRILNQTDPLGQFHKLKRSTQQSRPQPAKTVYTPPTKRLTPTHQPAGCATFIMLFILAVIVVSTVISIC